MSMSRSYATGSSAMQLRDLLRKYEIGGQPKWQGRSSPRPFASATSWSAGRRVRSRGYPRRINTPRIGDARWLARQKFHRELCRGGFEAVRRAEQPAEERWWYYIDIAQAA